MLRPKAAIGVDIGSSTVKVVQLRRTSGGVELEKAAVVPIFPDGERPGDPSQQRKAKVDAVRRARRQDRVVAAVMGAIVVAVAVGLWRWIGG